jgi:hypothetical protein
MMGKRSPEKEAYWRKLLRQQEKSGQSVLEFSRQHGLSEASFYHWKREIGRRDKQTSGTTKFGRSQSREKASRNSRKKNAPRDSSTSLFIPLQLTSAAASAIELVHPRGHVLRIPAVFDEGCLQQVLHLLDRDQEV